MENKNHRFTYAITHTAMYLLPPPIDTEMCAHMNAHKHTPSPVVLAAGEKRIKLGWCKSSVVAAIILNNNLGEKSCKICAP